MTNNNKINKFLSSCFGGLVIAMYMTAWKGNRLDFTLTTLLISAVVGSMGFIEIIEWGFKRLKRKKSDTLIILKRLPQNGTDNRNLTEVTMTIPNALKDKMLSGLKENFGVWHENLRMMEWENDTHVKFQFVLEAEDASRLEKGLMAMYRTIVGLDKITYN